jgi:alginate O-acetyltransferase complex protein AlgI
VLFNSVDYAVFFASVFIASWAVARWARGWVRIVLLLVASYGFYAHWDWRYLPLIFGSATVDFYLARAIDRQADPTRRRRLLIGTMVLNLGFLSLFKYDQFLLENLAVLRGLFDPAGTAGGGATVARLLPPVGISFFTFESMSYVFDVYRRRLRPHDSYLRYLLFVSFFPHLVAGPIVRAGDLLPQLARPAALTHAASGEGLFLIAVGLLKKVVIADQLAVQLVDRVFDHPQSYSALEVGAAVYGYAVQIYCDFSGYSDIAIGSALLLGIRFPKNFEAPYQAQNLTDFWRRWHISLSTWLRDYLYIPLGGSRRGSLRTYRNLLLTMVLGGLWHGASWTFVFWGLLHGLGLAVTRAWQRRSPETGAGRDESPSVMSRTVKVVLTFHYVCLCWVFFRAESFSQALLVFQRIASLGLGHANLPWVVLVLLALGLGSHGLPRRRFIALRQAFSSWSAPLQGLCLFAVALVVHEASVAQAVPFVYFQF